MKKSLFAVGLLLSILSSFAYAGQGPRCMIFSVQDTLVTPYAVPGHLSANGKIYVSGITSDEDQDLLYQWTRFSLDEPWDGPTLIEGAVNETADSINNMQPTITNNGLMLVYTRNKGGGWESNDLWMATRPSIDEPFDNIRSLAELNTDDAEAYPYLTASGSRLYYTAGDKIMVAEYDKKTKEFGRASEVKVEGYESAIACWVSADEKTILVSDGSTIFCDERSSVKKPFGESTSLTLEGVDAFVAGPSLDANGDLYIYISASNPSTSGSYEENLDTDDSESYDYDEEDYTEEAVTDSDIGNQEPETIQAILHLVCSEGE